jgi:tetratricopeptide (TPR) repeat protein
MRLLWQHNAVCTGPRYAALPLEQLQDARLSGCYALLSSQAHSNLVHWQEAAQQAEHAVEMARFCQDDTTAGQAYHVLAMQRYWMGQPRQGVAYSHEAIRALERSGQTYRAGMGYFVLDLNALLLGEFDRALEASSDPLNSSFAMGWLGYAYVEKGQPAEAIPLLEEAAQRLRQYDYRRLEGLYTIFLGEAHRLLGELDTARLCVRQGETLARGEKYAAGLAWAQRTFGRIALDQNDLIAAQEAFQEALTLFTGIQSRFESARTSLCLADLAQHQGNRNAVTLHLIEAYHIFVALQVPVYIARTAQYAQDLGLAWIEPLAAQ